MNRKFIPSGSSGPEDLSKLSARELVERIEAEEHLVEQYEARQRSAAKALLNAAMAQARKAMSHADSNDNMPLAGLSPAEAPRLLPFEPAAVEREGDFESAVEQIATHLERFSVLVERRLQSLSVAPAEAESSTMHNARKRLTTQLQVVLKQMRGFEPGGRQKSRAIA